MSFHYFGAPSSSSSPNSHELFKIVSFTVAGIAEPVSWLLSSFNVLPWTQTPVAANLGSQIKQYFFIIGFMIRRVEIITKYINLMIACGYYAKPWIFSLCMAPPGLSLWRSFSAHGPITMWQCSIQHINEQKLCLSHPCSLWLSEKRVQAKFMFLGEFWSDLKKMSKTEKSAAEQRLVNYKAPLS